MFSRPVLIGRGLGARARYGRLGGLLITTPPSGTPTGSSCVHRPLERKVSGGHSGRVTPVPIPNTEVKPASADGTWGETPRESRSSPEFISDDAHLHTRVGIVASEAMTAVKSFVWPIPAVFLLNVAPGFLASRSALRTEHRQRHDLAEAPKLSLRESQSVSAVPERGSRTTSFRQVFGTNSTKLSGTAQRVSSEGSRLRPELTSVIGTERR